MRDPTRAFVECVQRAVLLALLGKGQLQQGQFDLCMEAVKQQVLKDRNKSEEGAL